MVSILSFNLLYLKYLFLNIEIELPESVADHMYRQVNVFSLKQIIFQQYPPNSLIRMSMLSFAVRDPNVNRDRLMKICLVHDLAESIVGDITPYDGVSKEEKRKLEEVVIFYRFI